MRKAELTDDDLCAAVSEMERGLIDADLGGGIVKKRVRLPGRGFEKASTARIEALIAIGELQEICHDWETQADQQDLAGGA
ncbi:MAG: type II toxin-antitoxin system RelE/ParE family toxin [Burkholderiales bacterium]